MTFAGVVRTLTRARVPQLILGAVALVLMSKTERFFTAGTLSSILSLAGTVGVLAAGQSFALLSGGFDLSQGAALGLSAAVGAWVSSHGYGPYAAGIATLATGAILGSINGACIAVVRTNPFVTTLSTLLIFRGATFALLAGLTIPNVAAFAALAQGPTLGEIAAKLGLLPYLHDPATVNTLIPWRAFLFPFVALLSWGILRRTVIGQYVYAVGGNEHAARLAGIPTARVKILAFTFSGLAAGIAAMQLLAWVRVAKPDTGTGYELDSIAACVVGGISLKGGSGSVLGAALGCLLLQALGTLITMSGFPDEYRTLVTGAVILAFAAADALSRDPHER